MTSMSTRHSLPDVNQAPNPCFCGGWPCCYVSAELQLDCKTGLCTFFSDPGGTSVLEIWTWRRIRVQPPSQCFAKTGDKNSSPDGRNAVLGVRARVREGGRQVPIWDRKMGFQEYLACSLTFTLLCQHLTWDSLREGRKEVVMSSSNFLLYAPPTESQCSCLSPISLAPGSQCQEARPLFPCGSSAMWSEEPGVWSRPLTSCMTLGQSCPVILCLPSLTGGWRHAPRVSVVIQRYLHMK